jgi:hypothetical protein
MKRLNQPCPLIMLCGWLLNGFVLEGLKHFIILPVQRGVKCSSHCWLTEYNAMVAALKEWRDRWFRLEMRKLQQHPENIFRVCGWQSTFP